MKHHTPTEWAEFFGIEIVDPDGWRDNGISGNFDKTIDLMGFINKMNISTIQIVNNDKYHNILGFIS